MLFGLENVLLMTGNSNALAELNMAQAIACPLQDSESWITATTAPDLPTTEPPTTTEGNTTAPTMPKGETSSGINIK